MEQGQQIIEYPGVFGGTYRGDALGAGPSARKHGRGVMVWGDGMRYDGEWRDDKRSGRGVFTYADGRRYDGEWANGDYHGRGASRLPDGRVFDGAWARDCPLAGAALDPATGAVWRAACDG